MPKDHVKKIVTHKVIGQSSVFRFQPYLTFREKGQDYGLYWGVWQQLQEKKNEKVYQEQPS